MAWVRIDDQFDEHPKHQQAGPLAWALWAAGLAYCNRNLTDGFIPAAKARTLISWEFSEPLEKDGRRRIVTVCVTSGMSGEDVTNEYVIGLLLGVGLWEECDGGYMVHDYHDFQPTRQEVLTQRKGWADRQSRVRQRRKSHSESRLESPIESQRDNEEKSRRESRPSHTSPVPVPVPDQKRTKSEPAGGALSKDTTFQTEPDEPKSPEPEDNGRGPISREASDAQAMRLKLLDERHQALPPRDGFRIWPAAQRLYSAGLPLDTATSILNAMVSRWATILHPWAYLQRVLDAEYREYHIRVQEADHEATKQLPANVELIGEVMRRAGEKGEVCQNDTEKQEKEPWTE